MLPGMRLNLFIPLCLAAAVALIAGGCRREEPSPEPSPMALDRLPPMATLSRGERLFQEHCAQCHGPEAQGHPDWQTPGLAVAPPLNGTGNDWKRKKSDLIAVIKNGVKRKNAQVMPPWRDRLADDEIEDIIVWFQTRWPAEVYERWRKANAPSTQPKG